MSSIGTGPGISSGPQREVGATRPVSAIGVNAAGANPLVGAQPAASTQPDVMPSAASPTPQAQAAMVSSTALATGAPPLDTQRVTQIRKALENGTYPVIPTKISDAMIAAGMVLRIGK